MECNIHLHVEIKKKKTDYGIPCWVHCAFGGEFSYESYEMFSILGNVKFYDLEYIPIRGLPKDISWETKMGVHKPIIDKPEFENKYEAKYCYLKSDSIKWVQAGSSFYLGNTEEYCSSPDNHSYSWCTTEEMCHAVEKIFKDKESPYGYQGDYIQWVGLTNYMKSLESSGEFECRAVYWFDN